MLRTCTIATAGAALAAFALLSPSPARAAVACPGYENFLLCGELTGDCKITANDALTALKMAVGQTPPKPEADLDGSGAVTASDALRVLRVAVGSLPATSSCGPQVGVAAYDVGFYNQAGVREDGNYAAGWYAAHGDELRDYFAFDLSNVSGTITSALLHVATAPNGYIRYGSNDPSETYSLFDVSTDVDVLTGGTGGVAAFADLTDGTDYGDLVATSALGFLVDIPLNAAGVAYLNTISGKVALGGAITTLTKGPDNEFLFNSTDLTNTRQLVLTVE